MTFNKQGAIYTALGFAFCAGLVQSAENPRLGNETYYGSGYVERAPEFAEFTVNFSVSCLKSAQAVRDALEAKSAPVWKTVTSEITAFTETDRHLWGDVKNISVSDDSYVRSTAPSRDRSGKLIQGSAKRYTTCGEKPIAMDTPVGKVYSGTQTFEVRSSKLDWIDGLARTLSAMPQSKLPGEVRVSVGSTRYDVTEATKRDMRVEVQKQARDKATGPGSQFESDKAKLRFASAHFLGQRLSMAPFQNIEVKTPIEKGKAPVVTVELPFSYTVYAEAGDRASTSPTVVGLQSNYRAVGKKVSKADFAETYVTVTSGCIATADKAADKIKSQSADVLSQLKAVQGSLPSSETDRVIENEPDVSPQYPYQPVKWDSTFDENLQQFPVTEHLDNCTGKNIPAPAKGQMVPYYSISQTFVLKSSNFKGVIEAIESLRKKYGLGNLGPSDVTVGVSDAMANITDASKQKLLQEAREDAASCILDSRGSLAGDASGNKFTCVHLKSLRLVADRPQFHKGRAAGMTERSAQAESADAAPGGSPDQVEVIVIKKDGESRPRVTLSEGERHYAFDFQFETENYLPLLKGRGTPLP